MWENKRIAVYGVGGVGGYFGGLLAKKGLDVTFIDMKETYEALKKSGLSVTSPNGSFSINPAKVEIDPCDVGQVDLILVCVKAYQIESIIDMLEPLIKANTIILPIQNGIDIPTQLEKVYSNHVIGGVAKIFSKKTALNEVRHIADSEIEIGELHGSITPRILDLKKLLEYAGITVLAYNDFREAQWTKMMIVCPLSGVSSLTRSSVGLIRSIPETREMLKTAMEEILNLTIELGLNLNKNLPQFILKGIDQMPDDSTTSLQRDIMEGKPSELHFQVGSVVRVAEELGVYVPLNKFLYHSLIPFELKARKVID